MQFFAVLSKAIEGSTYISLGASFLWGIISVLISPCHLASIPLIIGYIGGQSDLTLKRAFQISLIFACRNVCFCCCYRHYYRFFGKDYGRRGCLGELSGSIYIFPGRIEFDGNYPIELEQTLLRSNQK